MGPLLAAAALLLAAGAAAEEAGGGHGRAGRAATAEARLASRVRRGARGRVTASGGLEVPPRWAEWGCRAPVRWLFATGEYRTFKWTRRSQRRSLEGSVPRSECWFVVVAAKSTLGVDRARYAELALPEDVDGVEGGLDAFTQPDAVRRLLESDREYFQGRLAYVLVDHDDPAERWRQKKGGNYGSDAFNAWALSRAVLDVLGSTPDPKAVVVRTRPDVLWTRPFNFTSFSAAFDEEPWGLHLAVGPQDNNDRGSFWSYAAYERDLARPLATRNGALRTYALTNLWLRTGYAQYEGTRMPPECSCLDQNTTLEDCHESFVTCHPWVFEGYRNDDKCYLEKYCRDSRVNEWNRTFWDVGGVTRLVYAREECAGVALPSRRTLPEGVATVLNTTLGYVPGKAFRWTELRAPLSHWAGLIRKQLDTSRSEAPSRVRNGTRASEDPNRCCREWCPYGERNYRESGCRDGGREYSIYFKCNPWEGGPDSIVYDGW